MGWRIHLIADFYPDDAQAITDVEWINDGLSRGWGLLTKDQRIRYRSHERGAAMGGALFMLSNGNLRIPEMVERFHRAKREIDDIVAAGKTGLWVVYADRIHLAV